jgi:hypothetical protein
MKMGLPCTYKQHFSEAQAKAIARSGRTHTGKRLHAYACPLATDGHWHTTTGPKPKIVFKGDPCAADITALLKEAGFHG